MCNILDFIVAQLHSIPPRDTFNLAIPGSSNRIRFVASEHCPRYCRVWNLLKLKIMRLNIRAFESWNSDPWNYFVHANRWKIIMPLMERKISCAISTTRGKRCILSLMNALSACENNVYKEMLWFARCMAGGQEFELQDADWRWSLPPHFQDRLPSLKGFYRIISGVQSSRHLWTERSGLFLLLSLPSSSLQTEILDGELCAAFALHQCSLSSCKVFHLFFCLGSPTVFSARPLEDLFPSLLFRTQWVFPDFLWKKNSKVFHSASSCFFLVMYIVGS